MIQLNYALLDSLGLGSLNKETKDSLLAHLYDKLELNVGTVIASQLSDTQLDEFEKLIDNNQQQEALSWLQQNYPDYKQVVERELAKLKAELQQNAGRILAADQPGQADAA
jgi:hypothetical protein